MTEFLNNLLELSLEAAPWLLLGLVIGGLIKALIPNSFLERHLSGSGLSPIVKAALLGAPLPLCSCGVIPAALGLRRAGASKPATISFLVSTPETGVDSIAISYALLGPFMAVVRPTAAIISAITAGLLVGRSEEKKEVINSTIPTMKISCCSSKKEVIKKENSYRYSQEVSKEKTSESCCSSSTLKSKVVKNPTSHLQNAWNGIVYSFTDLFDKVLFWLVIGLVFAALVKTFVPATFLAEWGSGLPAMLIMLIVGIPMYVCATASTPIAAGLLLAGVSPGTAMVYLMAGPATNISTLGVIGKELGNRALIAYLTGVCVIALLTGFTVDYLIESFSIDVQSHISQNHEMVPEALAWLSLLVLISVVIKLKFKNNKLKGQPGGHRSQKIQHHQ